MKLSEEIQEIIDSFQILADRFEKACADVAETFHQVSIQEKGMTITEEELKQIKSSIEFTNLFFKLQQVLDVHRGLCTINQKAKMTELTKVENEYIISVREKFMPMLQRFYNLLAETIYVPEMPTDKKVRNALAALVDSSSAYARVVDASVFHPDTPGIEIKKNEAWRQMMADKQQILELFRDQEKIMGSLMMEREIWNEKSKSVEEEANKLLAILKEQALIFDEEQP